MRERIIIDCDPGHDDAVALMLALASPEELDVLGITTVAGNAPAHLTQKNALMVCEFAGRPATPVYAGCERPLVRAPRHADVHGATGIDGFPRFEPSARPQQQHAVDFLIESLLAAEDDAVTLACLAPLTNVAVALIKEPRIAPKISKFVLMGGARSAGGNVTPAATFNIHFDPHAAHVVFTCGRPIVAISLDATSQVLSSKARLAELAGSGGRIASAVAGMVAHYDAVRMRRFQYGTDGAPVNDPCVIAYLLNPGLFTGKQVSISVELRSELTLGMTVVDFWGVTADPPNALWIYEANSDGIFRLLIDRITRL